MFDFSDLDYLTQQQLLDICDQDILSFNDLPVAEREVLWEKRYYLKGIPGALPKVCRTVGEGIFLKCKLQQEGNFLTFLF